jgi:hypothetical protein
VIVEYLIKRWPDVFDETPKQREANIAAGGMKPDWMTWEEWCDPARPGLFDRECHWYDDPEYVHLCPKWCNGALDHDHRPRIIRWYWASPLSWILPPIYFIRQGASVGLAFAISLGNKGKSK